MFSAIWILHQSTLWFWNNFDLSLSITHILSCANGWIFLIIILFQFWATTSIKTWIASLNRCIQKENKEVTKLADKKYRKVKCPAGKSGNQVPMSWWGGPLWMLSLRTVRLVHTHSLFWIYTGCFASCPWGTCHVLI